MHIRSAIFLLVSAALLPAPAAAQTDAAIRKAIANGVAYLKSHQNADGTWFFAGLRESSSHPVGVAALGGLALLECGIPASDAAVERAARAVRDGIRYTDATYDLSLAMLFLDRLGEAGDERLIEAAAVSLAAGQSGDGGWSYTCPLIRGETELHRLRTFVEQKNANPRADSSPRPQQRHAERAFRGSSFGDDNSNTQFATLALWVARRHHLNVDRTLAAVEKRFRHSQNEDGGWGYKAGGWGGMGGSTASMTCAGLLGLAVGQGVSREAILRVAARPGHAASGTKSRALPDPTQDSRVQRGLRFLARSLEPALQLAADGEGPRPPGRGGFPGRRGPGPGPFRQNLLGNGLGSEYYFLWSLERVAVVYGLKSVGDKDWYAIGSAYLMSRQQADGAWRGNLGEAVDTCFALFFLRRANLATDLTALLHARPELPRTVDLRAHHAGEERAPLAASPPLTAPPATANNAAEKDAARLGEQLVKAAPAEQRSLLARLRDAKGAAYTDALAAAISRLSGALQTRAGDALAERLSRMTPATLRDKLQDSNAQVRRAAALACAMRDETSLMGALIDLLTDPEPRVGRAAHVALKELTHEDFGPAEGATAEQQARAAARWREWSAGRQSK
jgi:hypothetical protein